MKNQNSITFVGEMMDLLKKYFSFTDEQEQRFAALYTIYDSWNAKINVISRKDMENFYERHVLHSLGIAKVIQFADNTRILDVGTGGGFPGIPLAIMFPQCKFLLVDSIGKKITVVKAVAEELGLTNVEAIQARAEQVEGDFDFVVSRAVTELPEFYGWVKNKIHRTNNNVLPNGILYLKGGDVEREIKGIQAHKLIKASDRKPQLSAHKKSQISSAIYELKDFFEEDFFETKKVVHIY